MKAQNFCKKNSREFEHKSANSQLSVIVKNSVTFKKTVTNEYTKVKKKDIKNGMIKW